MGAIDKATGGVTNVLKALIVVAVILAVVVSISAATGFLATALHDIGAFFHGIWVGGASAIKDMKENWH